MAGLPIPSPSAVLRTAAKRRYPRSLLALALGRRLCPRNDHLAGLALALAQAGGLADAVAEVVQLRPPHLASALHLDLRDPRRVQREDPLHALALHDPADGEHLVQPLAHACDHH